MKITQIVNKVNDLLAGEMLTFSQLCTFLDSVIDDINSDLNSCFPSFSAFEESLGEDFTYDADYGYIPDEYIRSVVTKGAAYKFYVTDEEGIKTAQVYGNEYAQARFLMIRDFSMLVPELYQRCVNAGYLEGPGSFYLTPSTTGHDIKPRDWFDYD